MKFLFQYLDHITQCLKYWWEGCGSHYENTLNIITKNSLYRVITWSSYHLNTLLSITLLYLIYEGFRMMS